MLLCYLTTELLLSWYHKFIIRWRIYTLVILC